MHFSETENELWKRSRPKKKMKREKNTQTDNSFESFLQIFFLSRKDWLWIAFWHCSKLFQRSESNSLQLHFGVRGWEDAHTNTNDDSKDYEKSSECIRWTEEKSLHQTIKSTKRRGNSKQLLLNGVFFIFECVGSPNGESLLFPMFDGCRCQFFAISISIDVCFLRNAVDGNQIVIIFSVSYSFVHKTFFFHHFRAQQLAQLIWNVDTMRWSIKVLFSSAWFIWCEPLSKVTNKWANKMQT